MRDHLTHYAELLAHVSYIRRYQISQSNHTRDFAITIKEGGTRTWPPLATIFPCVLVLCNERCQRSKYYSVTVTPVNVLFRCPDFMGAEMCVY